MDSLKRALDKIHLWPFGINDRKAARLSLIVLITYLLAAIIIARLVQLQILLNPVFSNFAKRQQLTLVDEIPKRGKIIDRNGYSLAESIETVQVGFHPNALYPSFKPGKGSTKWGIPDMGTANYVADQLAPMTTSTRSEILNKILVKKTYVLLSDHIAVEYLDNLRQIESAIPNAIEYRKNFKRIYPKDFQASQIVGFVDKAGTGQLGIEQIYQLQLAGKKSSKILYKGPKGQKFDSGVTDSQVGNASLNVELTIDSSIQQFAEDALQKAVQSTQPENAYVIVVNPNNGEILACASYPTFNPNESIQIAKSAADIFRARRLHPVVDTYEPGSTMKIFTAAIALDQNKVSLTEAIDCSPGFRAPGGRKITDTHPHGFLKLNEVLALSSNIGAVKVGMKIPPQIHYEYLERFGFNAPTGLNVPGESEVRVRPPALWSNATQTSLSFGYEIQTTPMHILMAGCAIANGGILISPKIVKSIQAEDGTIINESPTNEKNRVITEQTSSVMREILKDVVLTGTAKTAALNGVSSFGKTGTSYKTLARGGYSRQMQYASYMGFFPANKPTIGILVMLDGVKQEGGVVAAPVFREIGNQIVKYQRTPTDLIDDEPIKIVLGKWPLSSDEIAIATSGIAPSLKGLSLHEAITLSVQSGCRPLVQGNKGNAQSRVVAQEPSPGTLIIQGQVIKLQVESP